MKKYFKWMIAPVTAAVMLVSLSSFVEDDEGDGGGSECNMCVVKGSKLGISVTIFSCKPMANERCSRTEGGFTVSCENAKVCVNRTE
ncbi:hypothetical protein [Chitinophaga rhizosphaerae]|uniref:hypothetical protein n=1 Tax=Chitinophaga rhizosphaerae TaxID=1864947 RepID=UPI000F8070D7|nr:hypothetical protein [Chitinophaga rhizosphaerae]